jgi:hippurate hydrolase
VVTIARIEAGTTRNVIPETASLLGTIRTVSERTRGTVLDAVRRVAEGVAGAHGAEAEVNIIRGYPVTVNDPDFAGFVHEVSRDLLGPERAELMDHPIMGSEDFSYVLQRVPGTMLFLGGTHPDRDPRIAAANHSNLVLFDEDAMVDGVAIYSRVALRHLGLE